MTLVAKSLTRTFRPVVLWFLCAVTVIAVAASIVAAGVSDLGYSLWLIILGHSTKWWLLVVGTLLIATHLKLYVANGITRRDFLLGSALFGAGAVVAIALLIPAGHGVEQLVWTIAGTPPAGYPEFSAAGAVREFGHYLPIGLGFLVSGAFIGAAFYRFPWWAGLVLIVPGIMPAITADALLGGVGADPPATRGLPYAGALAVSLLVTLLMAAMVGAAMRDVTIRRTAG
jgi:hypothetical protein